MNSSFYAGVMTGTSLDAADAVLADFSNDSCRIVAQAQVNIPSAIAHKWRLLATDDILLTQAMDTANAVAQLSANAVAALNTPPDNIAAIGCHGQTVLHRPKRRWSVQLLNGALLAELSHVDVVCDFRARDIANGGQGAPLAPLFHHAVFAAYQPCVVINLGGIANISIINNENLRGWDVGPANMLMDAWNQRHNNSKFDHNGEWAATGTVIKPLLATLMAHPFLARPPPKSCGREEFDLRHFEKELMRYPPQNAQATLLEWTAHGVNVAVRQSCAKTIFLCGGGTRNLTLMSRLKEILPEYDLRLSDTIGLPAEKVEATAFAWLAKQFMERKALDASSVTGAHGPRILGAHYPR